MVYVILAASAFISATLFPGGSEGQVLYDVAQGYDALTVWTIATLANAAGSCVNYLIGRKGEAYLERKNYIKPHRIDRWVALFHRWGGWALLLSWMPVVGDPITLIAGALRYDFRRFVVLVVIAKGVRYAFVLGIYFYAHLG